MESFRLLLSTAYHALDLIQFSICEAMSNPSSLTERQVLAPLTPNSTVFNAPTSSNPDVHGKSSNAYLKRDVVHIPNFDSEPVKVQEELSPFERIKLETERTTAHGHPLILPTQYGQFGPVFDVFALYHNAVKRQILVAYNTLETLQRFKYEVTLTETHMFLDWFHTFEDVVITILAVEDEQIFPFLEETGVVVPESLITERKETRDLASQAVTRISESLLTIRLLAAGESVGRISPLVRAFLHIILNYIEVQRVSLPNAISCTAIPQDVESQLRLRVIQAFEMKNNASISLPFITHWLTRRQLAIWKKTNLSRLKSLRFEQWRKRFATTYQDLPVIIMKRLTSSTASGKPKAGRKLASKARQGKANTYTFR